MSARLQTINTYVTHCDGCDLSEFEKPLTALTYQLYGTNGDPTKDFSLCYDCLVAVYNEKFANGALPYPQVLP
jgi:hypothetical protein